VNIELVDLASVEKRGNQFTPTHHPNVFSRRRSKTLRECFHRLRHEFDPGCCPFRRLLREDVIADLCVEHPRFLAFLLVIRENPVVGFSAPHDGVNRPVERGHAVIEFAGPTIQPFDITVWPGNVAIGACRNVHDDFSMCFHETPFPNYRVRFFLGMEASILARFRQSGLGPDALTGKVLVSDYATNQDLGVDSERRESAEAPTETVERESRRPCRLWVLPSMRGAADSLSEK